MEPDKVQRQIQTAGSTDKTFLGTRQSDLGVEEHVSIPDDARLTHTLNIGPTGHGKSQLMTHTALQDAQKGRGLCIVNPKGGMIDEFLAKLPDDREDDVIYLNPNRQRVPAINVLEPHVTPSMTQAERDLQKDIILSDLTDVFRRLSESWGDRWGANLRTLLRAHLHLNLTRNEGNTLMDVFQCVINDDHLVELMNRIHKPVLTEELQQIHALSDREMEPLQRRFRDFLESETIRRLITQSESDIDFRDILDNQKILLVDVQKGQLGETTATLIGSIIITKVWAAAQSRITQPMEERTPFYLYVDELHGFSGEGSNFAKILSEAREYQLSLYLATQYLNQLPKEMRRAVKNNCRTKIFFNPSGSEDIAKIDGLLNGISREELKDLGKFRAVVQRPSTHRNLSAVTFDTYPPWESDADAEPAKSKSLQDYPPLRDQTQEVVTQKGKASLVGKAEHGELLKAAHDHFTDEGYHVNILHQEAGEDKTDAELVEEDGTRINLEAESTTLTSPGKVLKNVQRAAEQEREMVFVVDYGNGQKLQNILSDPVNRRGREHEDADGRFAYYQRDGEPVEDIDCVDDVEWRIFEKHGGELVAFDGDQDLDCPQLPEEDESSLRDFCLYRDPEDNHCSKLEAPCVFADD